MIPPFLARRVALQAASVGDAELAVEMCDDARRDLGQVGQEGAQEPHGTELYGEPETVVIAPALGDETLIRVVEMEVASQLRRRGLACVATVAVLLLFGQKVNGHPRPFLKSSPRLVAGCQIGSPRPGRTRTPQIIGFPWPRSCDKMGIP